MDALLLEVSDRVVEAALARPDAPNLDRGSHREGHLDIIEQALARAGLKVDDIDVFEVNEAFAPVLIAWSADTGASLGKTNPNGGAIALGHPLGATGAVLATKLLHELEAAGQVRRSGARRSTVWQLITDEERIAQRAAELERLRSAPSRRRVRARAS